MDGTDVERDDSVVVTEVVDRVMLLKINRVAQANAMNRDVVRRLRDELEEAKWNESISAVILTGEGEKVFCAGIDLKERSSLSEKEAFIDREKNMLAFIQGAHNFPKPIIGAINGPALGGGAELALICDIRVAVPSARFGNTEIKWGMIPSMGGIQRLRLIVGMGRAKELLLTGKSIEAAVAERYGIYNSIVEKEKLLEEAFSVANEIAANSQVGVRQTKRALDLGADTQVSMALDFELSKECFHKGDAFSGPTGFGK